ncbi:hypothetical protein RUM43_004142 [Polyplax serrata]|uniref:Uncharacterized protein n=1 Tax=Polyplax serrata TaxID=468196 RepID=A0AAN8XLF9_POLSC
MEKLAQFVTKTFEKKEIESDDGDGTSEDSLNGGLRASSPSVFTDGSTVTPGPRVKSPERVSPKSEAEKKENLQNVVDGLTNSQRKIMENLYQSLDIKNGNDTAEVTAVGKDAKKFNGIEMHNSVKLTKSNAMDVANLIGEQNQNKKLDLNFQTSGFSVQALRQSSRGSSVSPIIDPEDSRSSINSGSKKDHEEVRAKCYVGSEEDSKASEYPSQRV